MHKDLVYNLALSYVQNSEDAEEITQDVFIAVYQSISSFKAQANIKTWIYRIAINKSLDFIKAKKRQKRRPGEPRRAREIQGTCSMQRFPALLVPHRGLFGNLH
jgi:RNA polymerase sigma factor (sigma-70 family)